MAAGLAAVLVFAGAACASSVPSPTASGTGSTAPSSSGASSGRTGVPTSASRTTSEPASSTSSTPRRPLRTVNVDDGSGHSWGVAVWAEDHGADCLAVAYGATVRHFLETHPCRGVGRILAGTTVNGRPVAIAQEYAGFADPPSWNGKGTPPSYGYAQDFADLLRREGTGGLRSLIADGARFPGSGSGIRYPNAFDSTSQDSGAEMAEVWYLDGPPAANQPELVRLARAVFLHLG